MNAFDNIVVYPIQEKAKGALGGVELRAGPDLPDFERQTEARFQRQGHPRDTQVARLDEKALAELEYLDEEFAYGGCIFNHFGHFILDHCQRLAPSIKAHPTLRIIFCDDPINKNKPLPGFIQAIFEYFCIQDRILRVNRPVRVRRLYIHPQQEQADGPVPKLAYLEELAQIQSLRLKPGPGPTRIFVTRSQQAHSFAGETALDYFFTRMGWTVIVPEQLPLLKQLEHYSHALSLVFSEGSALHALQLLGRIRADLTVLSRRPRPFGPKFISPRVRSITHVSTCAVGIGGYTVSHAPARWTWMTILDIEAFSQFARNTFVEDSAAQLDDALNALRDELQREEFPAMLSHLERNMNRPLFAPHLARIWTDLQNTGRFDAHQLEQFATALKLPPQKLDAERSKP